jgi:hypothetical protein
MSYASLRLSAHIRIQRLTDSYRPLPVIRAKLEIATPMSGCKLQPPDDDGLLHGQILQKESLAVSWR